MATLEVAFMILPIFVSGLTFIILLKLNVMKKLAYPLDAGLKWHGKRLLGRNKTVRGLIVMGFCTMIYGFGLYYLWQDELHLPFDDLQVVVLFLLVGLAYSLGELPNSFIKRRLSIPAGGDVQNGLGRYLFRFFDTFDSLFACGLVYILIWRFPMESVLAAISLGGGLHLFTDKLMQLLGLK